MTDRNIFIAPYRELGNIFEAHGHQLYLVGGSVRDFLVGDIPKDIDFATSATPDEQIAIYESEGLSWIPTGLDHGTISVKYRDEYYEITTFRIDKETDGRHAKVEYTRDIELDLARRDLTINAIAMDFDGIIIDPFGGEKDLRDGVIRFVGNPSERIAEDYLRIMRFFRFYGRFGKIADEESLAAIADQAMGLVDISVERIWAELSKTMANINTGARVIGMMQQFGIDRVIGVALDRADYEKGARATSDPAMLLGYMHYSRGTPDGPFAGQTYMRATNLKLSRDELARMKFAAESVGGYTRTQAEADLLRGIPRDRVISAVSYHGRDQDAQDIAEWEVPNFPVTGEDLISVGYKQGPAIGNALTEMQAAWVKSRYQMTKEQIMLEFVSS